MDKAPQPSLLGLSLVVALLVFLIWLGPVERHKEISDSIQHGTVNCNQDPTTLTNIQLELCMDIASFSKDTRS
jgi:hypothetical protein